MPRVTVKTLEPLRSTTTARFKVTRRGHSGNATTGYSGPLPVVVSVMLPPRREPCHVCGKPAYIVTEASRQALCPEVGATSGVIVCESLGRLLP